MSTNFPGAKSHGTPQDTEMDVAWQELMAITEMQVLFLLQNVTICLCYPRYANYCRLSQYLIAAL